jgi:lysine 6-dehydrogenase
MGSEESDPLQEPVILPFLLSSFLSSYYGCNPKSKQNGNVDTVLKECGMLESTPVNFKNMKISPREFLSFVITPGLKPLEGETDVCVMWNTVTGVKNGQKIRIDYYMWEGADLENGISAMGRVTAFPEAIATVMLGKGEITKKGIVAPEDAIEGKIYEKYFEELKRRKINILEVSKKM